VQRIPTAVNIGLFICVHLHVVTLFYIFLPPLRKSFGILTCYGLDGAASIPGSEKMFSSPQRPDGFWGSPNLLPNGAHSPGVMQQGREANHSTTSMSRSKKVELYLNSPFIHGIMLK
jgi:hypothetical protein